PRFLSLATEEAIAQNLQSLSWLFNLIKTEIHTTTKTVKIRALFVHTRTVPVVRLNIITALNFGLQLQIFKPYVPFHFRTLWFENFSFRLKL
ncbi:MAG: hypothetical protein PHV68_06745, partial [Candidatus Gastranaerophilales bacterium]|nr:hypothetical protein [Candidatus Gastranaerophilales bacterium]